MINLKCPSCGAELNFKDDQEMYFCEYCGAKVMVTKSVTNNYYSGSTKMESADEMFKKWVDAIVNNNDVAVNTLGRNFACSYPSDERAIFAANRMYSCKQEFYDAIKPLPLSNDLNRLVKYYEEMWKKEEEECKRLEEEQKKREAALLNLQRIENRKANIKFCIQCIIIALIILFFVWAYKMNLL